MAAVAWCCQSEGVLFLFCPGLVEEDSSILGWHDRYGRHRPGREFCTVHSGRFVLLCQVLPMLGSKIFFQYHARAIRKRSPSIFLPRTHRKGLFHMKGWLFLLTELQVQCKSDGQGSVIISFFRQQYLKDEPLVYRYKSSYNPYRWPCTLDYIDCVGNWGYWPYNPISGVITLPTTDRGPLRGKALLAPCWSLLEIL